MAQTEQGLMIYPDRGWHKSPVWMQYTASWGVDGAGPEDVAAKAGQLWTFVVEPGDGDPELTTQAKDLWWIPLVAIALPALAWAL